jgi:transposase-like protein
MRQRRSFSPEFKAQIVLELISGTRTSAEICRQHQLSPHLLAQWKTTFVDRASTIFESGETQTQESARVAELERLVGRMTLETEVLKKASSILQQRRSNGGR